MAPLEKEHASARQAVVTVGMRRPLGERAEQSCKRQKTSPSALSLMECFSAVDAAAEVLSFLDVLGVARLQCVSRFWRAAGALPHRWKAFLRGFRERNFVLPRFSGIEERLGARAALLTLLEDRQTRVRLTHDELLGMEWSFRFKEAAGEHWVAIDPHHVGKEAMRFRFCGDGTVSPVRQDASLAPIALQWSFADVLEGTGGATRLHLTVDGRRVPTYHITRVAQGWIMESCWGIYASFALPPKGTCPALEDENLSVTVQTQVTEVIAYNHGVPLAAADCRPDRRARADDASRPRHGRSAQWQLRQAGIRQRQAARQAARSGPGEPPRRLSIYRNPYFYRANNNIDEQVRILGQQRRRLRALGTNGIRIGPLRQAHTLLSPSSLS